MSNFRASVIGMARFHLLSVRSFRSRGSGSSERRALPLSAQWINRNRWSQSLGARINGMKKGASGPLRKFESWFRPHRCADLPIDDSGFGINAADTRVLLERLKALPNSEIRARQRLYIEMHVRRERPWRWFRRARMPTIRAVG